MGRKEIYVSDLTDQQAQQDDLEQLVILDHPEHGEVVLEVLATDIQGLTDVEDVFITLEWLGQRRIVRLEDFNRLATHMPMDDVLKEKAKEQRRSQAPQQGRRRGRPRSGSGKAPRSTQRIDYGSPDGAGVPHRGRITDIEKQLVSSDVAQANRNRERVNKERQAEGKPPFPMIDPNNPEDQEKYDLGKASSRAAVQARRARAADEATAAVGSALQEEMQDPSSPWQGRQNREGENP